MKRILILCLLVISYLYSLAFNVRDMDLSDDFFTPLDGFFALIFYCIIGFFILLALYSIAGLFFIRLYDLIFLKKYIIIQDTIVSYDKGKLIEYLRLQPLADFYSHDYYAMERIFTMEKEGFVITLQKGTICRIKGFDIFSDYSKIIVDGRQYFIEADRLERYKRHR